MKANTISNPLTLTWNWTLTEYKVNKPNDQSGEYVDKGEAEKVLASLKAAYEYFSNPDFIWEGRDTALGQFVLAHMKSTIENS